MTGTRGWIFFSALVVVWLFGVSRAQALPTMVRLGYSNCVACHIAPQGGGLLTPYGKAIDGAQSLQVSDYQQSQFNKWSSFGGWMSQDVRAVLADQVSSSPGQGWNSTYRARFFYRNATELRKGFRISAVVAGENEPSPRKSLAYESAIRPGQAFVSQALLQYRPKEGLEFAVGRDQLPTGLFLPDQTTFIRSRNRSGYYDNPTQAKLFWWGKRFQISPFVFAPSGQESPQDRESGAGTVAEFDLLGNQRTIVGTSILRANGRTLDRQMTGAFTRLGFGRWGVFCEHDFTGRQERRVGGANFMQQATYLQAFLAVREWLVPSVAWERLSVEKPYEEHLMAGKFEVAARLTHQITINVAARVSRDLRAARTYHGVTLQLALKSWQ